MSGFDFGALSQRLLEQLYSMLATLPLLALSILIVWFCARLGGWLSNRGMVDRLAKRNIFLKELARTTIRWVAVLIGILIGLEILGATALVGAVLGTAGVLGVALGFAFKDTFENYLAGVLMSLRQPFSPRDYVVIDGNEGTVLALTSRATILMTPDGNHLRLPNALVFRSVILNYTRNPSRRFGFDVGIGVNEDLTRAQQIGVDVLAGLDGVVVTPPPRAYIAALGDSNVQLRFHGWVDQREHEFLLVKSEAIRQVKLALEAAEMDMPEPIYRVQLSEPAASLPRSAATVTPAPAKVVAEAVDTRTLTDIEQQIDQDQRTHQSVDLLSESAPRE